MFLYTEIMFKLSASYNKILFANVAPLYSVFRATEAARIFLKSKNWTPMSDSGYALATVNFLPTMVYSKTIIELSVEK